MNEAQIALLEREVEGARSRVRADLAVLRDPESLTDLKRRALNAAEDTKKHLTARAQEIATNKATGLYEDVRARIAANPGAAAAIAGGLAWRLFRHPPVASALVGLGIAGLLRADPAKPSIGSGMAARVVETATQAKDGLQNWRDGESSEKHNTLAATAQDALGEWTQDTRLLANRATGEIYRGGTAMVAAGKSMTSRIRNEADEDTVMLGLAAVAMATAVGISYERNRRRQ